MGLPITRQTFGEVIDLLEHEEGVFLIVSKMVDFSGHGERGFACARTTGSWRKRATERLQQSLAGLKPAIDDSFESSISFFSIKQVYDLFDII